MTDQEIYQKFIDRLYTVAQHKAGNVDIVDHEGMRSYYDSIQQAYDRFKHILNYNYMTDAKRVKEFILTHDELMEFDEAYRPNKSMMERLGFKKHSYRQAVKGREPFIKDFCKFLVEQIRYNKDQVVYHQENTIDIEIVRGQEITKKVFVLSTKLPFTDEEIDITFPRDLEHCLDKYEQIDVQSERSKSDTLQIVLEYYLDHGKISLL